MPQHHETSVNQQDLAQAIVRVSHLTAAFRLRSGEMSAHYFDKYQFETDPALLCRVASALAPLVPTDTEILAGLELGGIPLATALALNVGLPVVFVRKEQKAYGTEKLAEGVPIAGKRLCVVEDVITTGGQVVKSTEALRARGAIVDWALCVIWRGRADGRLLDQAGIRTRCLFDIHDLAPWIDNLLQS